MTVRGGLLRRSWVPAILQSRGQSINVLWVRRKRASDSYGKLIAAPEHPPCDLVSNRRRRCGRVLRVKRYDQNLPEPIIVKALETALHRASHFGLVRGPAHICGRLQKRYG